MSHTCMHPAMDLAKTNLSKKIPTLSKISYMLIQNDNKKEIIKELLHSRK